VFSHPVAQTSLNGVTGKPSDAAAEEGASLFSKMVDGLSGLLEKAITDEPPLPPEEWGGMERPRYD